MNDGFFLDIMSPKPLKKQFSELIEPRINRANIASTMGDISFL